MALVGSGGGRKRRDGPFLTGLVATRYSSSNMRLTCPKDLSVSVASFYLRLSGFWLATSRREQLLRNATILYTIIILIFFLWLQMRGLYFSLEDFVACIFIICNSVGLVLNLTKIIIVFIHKRKFLNLIAYMQNNFWHSNYDQNEHEIIADAKYMCIYFVCVFAFFSQCTVFSYMITPILENIGKNESERVLIFNMWLDLPLSISPYFEIAYAIQALSLYHTGVCYLCFDNIFCIMCLHVGGQFRVLQYRISKMSRQQKKRNFDEHEDPYTSEKCYAIFKNCIEQHQTLIEFCDTMEVIFREIAMDQVIIFSILICFIGYQLVSVNLSVSYKTAFVSFLLCTMCQLWMFTYSCDFVTQESANVGSAIYTIPWTDFPMDKHGKMLRKDCQLLIMRTRRACCLTACGFFPISLDTYTKIMSTAMSYFTILKQNSVNAVDT
ncbi:PREDICTED: odorant receptor 13a-like [Eufriesea mexicana]|uniref:odorant receptor 13a-like n=1 Tax=Eufriesea mexicana TaxID=516756 RepID=UPI00083C2213|nr:PREDICTED: odorant receptor 13a-like [Eufriesea mexicana]